MSYLSRSFVLLALIVGCRPRGATTPPSGEAAMRRTKTRLALLQTAKAIDLFRATTGRYPDSLEELSAGPLPLDGWDRPLFYERTHPAGYDLRSLGADGEPGGRGEDADLTLAEARR